MRNTSRLIAQGLFAALLAMGLIGSLTFSATAQSVRCTTQPALGAFDADGDGILTVAEVRAADPNNADLQAVADQMDAQGISGVKYTGGCDDAGDGSGTGTGDGSGTGAGSGTGTGTGDGSGTGTGTGDGSGTGTGTDDGSGTGTGAGDGTTTDDQGNLISVLPSTGQGTSGAAEIPMGAVVLGFGSLIAMAAAFGIRQRRLV